MAVALCLSTAAQMAKCGQKHPGVVTTAVACDQEPTLRETPVVKVLNRPKPSFLCIAA